VSTKPQTVNGKFKAGCARKTPNLKREKCEYAATRNGTDSIELQALSFELFPFRENLTIASQDLTLAENRMTKEQFWTLNVAGGVCSLLLLLNLILSQLNEETNRQLILTQNQIARAQQMQQTIQNLAVRIAQAGQTDPALSAILTRQDLKVRLNEAEEPTKPKP